MQSQESVEIAPLEAKAVCRLGTENRGRVGTTPDVQWELVTRRLDELLPHSSYVRHRLSASASQLSTLFSIENLAFRDPIMITRLGTIIDGYARFEVAKKHGRETLCCIECDLSEEDALRWLIQRHGSSRGLNAFNRILLALDLETILQETSRCNQQHGGQCKRLSNLTEAQKLDVRSEIAKIAGVSVGNVTKVKQLLKSSHSDLLQALRMGEMSIHRAWKWSKAPIHEQCARLRHYRSEKGVNRKIRALIAQHQTRGTVTVLELHRLAERLVAHSSGACKAIAVSIVKIPQRTIFITEELWQELQGQGA